MIGYYAAGRVGPRRRGLRGMASDGSNISTALGSLIQNNAIVSDITALTNAGTTAYNTVAGNLPSQSAVNISSMLPVIIGGIILVWLLKK